MKGTESELRQQYMDLKLKLNVTPKRTSRQVAGEKKRRGILAEQLLGLEQWDWVLTEIQQMLEVKREELAKVRLNMLAVKPMTDNELRACRDLGLVLQEAIRMLEWIADLPRVAVKEGHAGLIALRDSTDAA